MTVEPFDWSKVGWSCKSAKWTIMDQAIEMGMRVERSRKRMRHRVRQKRKVWDPYVHYVHELNDRGVGD